MLRHIGFQGFDVGESPDLRLGVLQDLGGVRKLLADQKDARSCGGGLFQDGQMLGCGIYTQFEHVAQHQHLVVEVRAGKIVQGSLHAGRIGIVGVDDQGVAFRFDKLAAAVRRRVGLDGFHHALERNLEIIADGQGGHHIVGIVVADQVGCDRHGLSFVLHFHGQERRLGRGGQDADTLLLDPVAAGAEARTERNHLAKIRIVGIVEDHTALLAEVVVQFSFCLLDALKRAEALQVGLAHGRDQAAGGLGNLRERRNLAGCAGAHFHDGHLRMLVEAEQRERHADVVVEVGLSGYQVVRLGQYGRHQLLGRRLAVGAGDAHDGNVELPAVVSGQLLQHGQGILHHDALASFVGRSLQEEAVDDGVFGAGLQGVLGKVIAVELFTFQREKHHAFLDLPTVCRDSRTLLVEFV